MFNYAGIELEGEIKRPPTQELWPQLIVNIAEILKLSVNYNE